MRCEMCACCCCCMGPVVPIDRWGCLSGCLLGRRPWNLPPTPAQEKAHDDDDDGRHLSLHCIVHRSNDATHTPPPAVGRARAAAAIEKNRRRTKRRSPRPPVVGPPAHTPAQERGLKGCHCNCPVPVPSSRSPPPFTPTHPNPKQLASTRNRVEARSRSPRLFSGCRLLPGNYPPTPYHPPPPCSIENQYRMHWLTLTTTHAQQQPHPAIHRPQPHRRSGDCRPLAQASADINIEKAPLARTSKRLHCSSKARQQAASSSMARLPTTHLSPILSLFLLLLLLPACHAHLELAQTLGSHMVLQRAPHRAAIYGRADPLAPVAVTVQRDAVINGVRAMHACTPWGGVCIWVVGFLGGGGRQEEESCWLVGVCVRSIEGVGVAID